MVHNSFLSQLKPVKLLCRPQTMVFFYFDPAPTLACLLQCLKTGIDEMLIEIRLNRL